MENMRSRRECGTVLFGSLVLVMTLLVVTGYAMTLSLAESKAVIQSTEHHSAFYLAEAGLEMAWYEIVEGTVATGQNTTDLSGAMTKGDYNVTVEKFNAGDYRVTSSGNVGGTSVTLEQVFKRNLNSTFPDGAVVILGNIRDVDVKIEEDGNLIIDGGSAPALAFSDLAVRDRVGAEFADAIDRGDFPAYNLTGSPTFPFTFGNSSYDLPIVHIATYDQALENFSALYIRMVDEVNQLRSDAGTVIHAGDLSGTYGSEASPVTMYVPNPQKVQTGQTVTGYGTLIIGENLNIDGALTWYGNVFVVGDDTRDSKLEVHDGALNVTGNLVILGEGILTTRLKVSGPSATTTINGSLFLCSGWNTIKAESRFEVEHDASLTVNGLVTMVGAEIDIEFDPGVPDGSNQVSRLEINGMLQIAVPKRATDTELEIEFEGDVSIIRDETEIRKGLAALKSLEVDHHIPQFSRLINDGGVTPMSWRRVH